MNNLIIELMCISMRNSVNIWLEKSRMDALYLVLEKSRESRFITFDGTVINTADIVGIFTSQQMDEMAKRKRGLWPCRYGEWHARTEHTCGCGHTKEMRRKSGYDFQDGKIIPTTYDY
jgi:hypothetical protein